MPMTTRTKALCACAATLILAMVAAVAPATAQFPAAPDDAAAGADVESAYLVPPEVLAGQEPDEASDIYAMGVLLYRSLSGKPPYAGDAGEVLCTDIVYLEPPPA